MGMCLFLLVSSRVLAGLVILALVTFIRKAKGKLRVRLDMKIELKAAISVVWTLHGMKIDVVCACNE